MAVDEMAYLHALLWHLKQPDEATESQLGGIGYPRAVARLFERAKMAFGDPWVARVWLEFSRIEPGLTPALACRRHGYALALAALERRQAAPLPFPHDPADEALLAAWLTCPGSKAT